MTAGVSVREVTLPREAGRFVRAWFGIHQRTENWVPPLLAERKRFLHPGRNPYFEGARVRCFMAEQGGRAVGTIAATVDERFEAAHPRTGLFGFFEFVEDEAVADALFQAASKWLSGQGMLRALGPFNFNTNHEFGLLIEGFGQPPHITTLHAPAYYMTVYDRLGFVKARDWYAYRFSDLRKLTPRLERLASRVERNRSGLSVRSLSLRAWDRDIRIVHEIYNEAWAENWGFVSIGVEEFSHVADSMKQLLDPELCCIAEIDGKAVGVAIAMPDYNQILAALNGRLWPFGWFHLWRGRSHIDTVLILIVGMRRSLQHAGLGAPMYARLWRRALERGMRSAATSLVLESNRAMRRGIEKIGGVVDRTYRTYERAL